jgi:hypothetical protein
MKELKEQFPVPAEQGSFDGPEEVDTVQFWLQKVDTMQFWLQKEAVKWRIDVDTWRVWASYWGSREILL